MSATRVNSTIALLINTALLIITLSASNPAQTPATAKTLKILFIGNSLTYSNDLPAVIADIVKSEHQQISYKTIAYANFSLEDHWHSGEAMKAIKKGEWHFVVLQQGPSASAAGRRL